MSVLKRWNGTSWEVLGSPSGVSSVAGRTGAVTLTAADVDAGTFPSGNYVRAGNLSIGSGTFTGWAFAANSPGASVASRYVGATTTGPPVSGTFATGDFVVSQDGGIWVCTVGGTSGTWAPIGMVDVNGGTNIIRIDDGTAPSSNATNGIHLYSASGRPKFRDAAGNVWNGEGPMMFRSTATTPNTTVTLATINNLTTTLQPGTYAFDVYGTFTSAVATTGCQFGVAFSGTQTAVNYEAYGASGSATSFWGATATIGTKLGPTATGPGATITPYRMSGSIEVTAAGTLSIQLASGVATSAVTAQIGTWLRVMRIA